MRRPAIATLALALVVVGAGVRVEPAAAGTYWVSACSSSDMRNNSMTPVRVGSGDVAPGALGACYGQDGLWTATLNSAPAYAAFEFCAPAGTTIQTWNVWHRSNWSGGGFGVDVEGACGSGGVLRREELPSYSTSVGWRNWDASGQALAGVRLGTWCAWYPCGGSRIDTYWQNAWFEINDPVSPAVGSITGVGASIGWLRGASQPLGFTVTDNAGVQRAEATVVGRSDLAWVDDASGACDYTRRVPCPATRPPLAGTLDTTKLADGTHTLSMRGRDTAQNWSTATTRTFRVDNAAPAVTLVRAPGDYSRTITWKVTDASAGVDPTRFAATYTLGGVTAPLEGGTWDAATSTYTARVPAGVGGELTLRLTAADLAKPSGNTVDKSGTASVDDLAPVTRIDAPTDWVNADELADAVVRFSGVEPLPATGITGYSFTTDGTEPDTTIDSGGAMDIAGLPDGTTTIKARAISGAGIAGPTARATVRIDRLAPTLSLLGAGDPLTPHPGPITVTISARDATSGMGEPGGYVAYRLDGAAEVVTPGDEVQVSIRDEGLHTLEYRAFDRAGNATHSHERGIRIQPAGGVGRPRRPFYARSVSPAVTFAAAPSFATACPSPTTLAADRDASVAESGSSDTALRIRSWAGVRAVSLVGFPLPAAPHCALQTARLRVFVASGRPAQVDVRRAGAAWSETSVTWESRPGSSGLSASGEARPGEWLELDVTSLVDGLYRLGNNGFELATAAGDLTVAAREDGATTSAQLVLEFRR